MCSSKGSIDIEFKFFSRSRMVAILDFEVKMTSKLKNNHSSGFLMPKSWEKDTSFVLVAHLAPEKLHLMFFKMADSGHLGFRG